MRASTTERRWGGDACETKIAGAIDRIFEHEAVPRTQDPEDVMALECSTRAGERWLIDRWGVK
jgi:hypothetical protein